MTNDLLITKNWSWLVLLCILLVAPFYYQPNLGGKGLMIPSNVTVWFVVSIFIWLNVRNVLSKAIIELPSKYTFILVFPVFATLSGFISDVSEPTVWAFRLLYLWGGVFFLFSLFQLKMNRRLEDYLLLIIVISGLLHALIALAQYFQPQNITFYLPTVKPVNQAVGMFQQINIQASFQSTVIISSWYLICRPLVSSRPLLTLTILITVFFSTYLVLISGSRVGTLSLILGVVLLCTFSWKVMLRDKKMITVVLLVMLTALFLSLSSGGISKLTNKALHTEYAASERIGIYKISAELIKQQPLVGHGLGSFGSVWQFEKGRFQQENPNYELIQAYVSHPHNELLFWQVEGGLLASLGILVTFFTICVLAWRAKSRYVLALLFPLAFHNQVELPFHTSSYAWVVCLILIFIALNHNRSIATKLNFTPALRKTLQISNHVLLVLVSVFFLHTLVSSHELRQATMLGGKADLAVPMANPYFSSLTEDFYMQQLFKISSVEHSVEGMQVFNDWQKEEINKRPVEYNFKLLIASYQNLQHYTQACETAEIASNIYAENQEFLDYKAYCTE